MAKDPAFLFYTGDFSTGTQFFTDEQLGKYVRLLMAQHQLGHLHEKHMIQICKTHDKDVFDKFVRDENGLYYNIRLENEIISRKKYSESRSENRKNKNISKTYDSHMEDKDKDSLIVKNTLTISNGTWEGEKHQFLISEQWQMKQISEFGLNKEKMTELMNVFLKEIENKEDYKDLKELKKHWYNWYKFQQNGKQKQPELSEYQKKLLNAREEAKKRTA